MLLHKLLGASTSINEPISVVGFSNTTNASTTLNFPAGIQQGDVAVYFGCRSGSFVAVPSGFTSIYRRVSSEGSDVTTVAYKILNGNETNINVESSSSIAKMMVVFRGASKAKVVDTPAATNSSLTPPSVTSDRGGCAVTAAFYYRASQGNFVAPGAIPNDTALSGWVGGSLSGISVAHRNGILSNDTVSFNEFETNPNVNLTWSRSVTFILGD
jgi:hypothetical protein